MYLKRNWTVCQWELVFVCTHNHRQKKRAIWIRSVDHCAKGREIAAASASDMMSSRRMHFSCFGGGS